MSTSPRSLFVVPPAEEVAVLKVRAFRATTAGRLSNRIDMALAELARLTEPHGLFGIEAVNDLDEDRPRIEAALAGMPEQTATRARSLTETIRADLRAVDAALLAQRAR
jgi:hypothetical protein